MRWSGRISIFAVRGERDEMYFRREYQHSACDGTVQANPAEMANAEQPRNPLASLVHHLLVASNVGATTRESRLAGRKSLAQPFKAGQALNMISSPVGTAE